MRSRSSRGIVPAVVALLIAACADDATGPPEGGVAGNWTVSYTDDATGCGEGVTAGIVNVLIAQNGNVLTVTSDGIVFTGTLNGTEATWSGSYPEDGGTTSEQFTVTFANNNTTLSGGSTWTWTDGTDSCSGTSTITGSKLGPEGGVAGNWAVSFSDDATGCGEGITTGTVNLLIAQNGNALTVTGGGIVFTGTLNGTEATWSGSYPEDGGTTSEQFTVTFANNNTTLSGGSTWTWTDGTDSCSGTSTITGSKL